MKKLKEHLSAFVGSLSTIANMGVKLGKKWTIQCDISVSYNKRRTSKVGAIYKAQKAQNIFFENVA